MDLLLALRGNANAAYQNVGAVPAHLDWVTQVGAHSMECGKHAKFIAESG